MQPAAGSSGSARCSNFRQAQQVAINGVQWLFGCLPCVKGHHRVHPTNLGSSDELYIAIDAKKRLRVLHLVPDPTNFALTVKTSNLDQVDSGDRCSLDSAGEDYWFMRWNRPIRPNLQRNSCHCSFRRSQIKSKPDGKESKSVECQNGSVVLSVLEEKANLQEPAKNEAIKGGLHILAERMSQNILVEAVLKSSEITTGVEYPTNISDSSSKCCDNVSLDNVKPTVRESEIEFGGYVNPVFLASNDALDLIPSDKTPNDSCDNQFVANQSNPVEKDQDSFFNEHQDYNANDQNQHTFEGNSNMKPSVHIMELSARSLKDNTSDKKKHRKSCLAGSKGHTKKPLLLLIHGAGSNCEVWRNLISHLLQGGYECVAPDLLGHGLSSAPDHASSYKFHALLQDLLFIFDRFVAEGRTAVILGHGYGCSLAAAIARYRPEQVTQLVLISGGGPTPLAPRIPPSVSPCLRACLEPLLMCGFKRDVVYSVCGKQMEPCSPETSGVPRHIVQHISQGHVWPEGDAAFHRRIVAPTLLVHGMKDQHITLVQECEMERTIPRSFLEVIPEAGHWAMLETPSHLSHMILCFIDWWAPPNRAQ